jgi:cytochrome c peroxidase
MVLVGCVTAETPLPEPPSPDPDRVQRGGMLFLTPLSTDGTRSCATCHPGGGTNGRAYAGAEEVPPGSPGARDVPALWGLWQTPPYLADGSAGTPGEALDHALRVHMGDAALPPEDRDALEAYLLSVPPFYRGRVDEEGFPVEPATRSALEGEQVFRTAGCAGCHPPPAYTEEGRFDVGTDGEWTIPSLRGLSTTPPYGHDGRWATVEEAVRAILRARDETLSERDLRKLLAYLELL